MRLHILKQGVVEAIDALFDTDDGEQERVSGIWPVRCYLIEHPGGWLLWDTGLPESVLLANPAALGGSPKRVLAPLLPWLAGFGLKPGDLAFTGFSHLHVDHAGNANTFARCPVLIGAREYDEAFGPSPMASYRPEDYAAIRESELIRIEDRYDVFGDGWVVVESAPGHTRGHQILVLRPPDEQAVILAGDAFITPEDLVRRRTPSWNDDREATLATMERIARLTLELDARLLIHHDPSA